ncbi:MAG TPA: patatin-like phospholipase family protein [Planctomycetota bacterium]|nr:patatin-like phospholipase family protein [Planctomycetota bacterium]
MEDRAESKAGLAVVLTGGGARAAYQVGILAALAERAGDLEVPILTGASAGAINAAFLASHPGPLAESVRALRERWMEITADLIYGPRPPTLIRSVARWMEKLALGWHEAPLEARGFFDTRALRGFLKDAIDFDGIGTNLDRGRLRAVGLTATAYDSGSTVTFVQGAPDVPLWERSHRIGVLAKLSLDHLMASAAIPIIFPAVRLGETFYGDGSVRQTFPLSPAVHLGARRILAIGTRAGRGEARAARMLRGYPSVAQSLGLLLDSVFMDHLDADAEVLESVNRLRAGRPDENFRTVDLLLIRPSRDLGEIAAECADGLPRLLRSAARGLGAESRGGAEFLSYLLFDPAFTDRLYALGREDGLREWSRMERLLEAPDPDPRLFPGSARSL